MRFFLGMLIILFSFPLAFADGSSFSCSIRTSCQPQEICLFSVSDTENAHSSDCSSFDYKVCCTNFASAALRTSCTAGETGILSISNITGDAHVAEYYDPFSLQVCVGYDGEVSCQYSAEQPANYKCVVGMSAAEGAHVGSCNDISGGALWCALDSIVEGHTFAVEITQAGDASHTISIDGVGEVPFSSLSTQTYPDAEYMFGSSNNTFAGIVLSEGSAPEGKTEKNPSEYGLRIRSAAEDGTFFLFFTRGELADVKVAASLAVQQPQFRFGAVELTGGIVTVGLEMSQFIDLQGDDVLSPGIYELIIRGADTTANAEVIEVTRK